MSSTPPGQNPGHSTWNSLSEDIRLLILQTLIQDGCALSRLATVSREWQQEFERHTFARIKLTPSRLPEFDSMTRRNRGLIRYLWLCLELDDYDCTQSGCIPLFGEGWIESIIVKDTMHGPITTTFERLLSVLSKWDPSNDLILDISIYSPSDSKHWFKYLTFEPDTPVNVPDNGNLEPPASLHNFYDDPEHGWVAGSQRFAPPRKAILKVFHPIFSKGPFDTLHTQQQWWDQLPSVPAVTSLFLRQQNRRDWFPRPLAHMFARFPRLQEIHYEPWRRWSIEQNWIDQGQIFAHLL